MNLVTFSDLAHTGPVVDADNSPLAVGYIAAYSKKRFGAGIEPRLFKYPAKLAAFLKVETPKIAAFSNYMWNEQLSLSFARAIKKHRPEVVTVFGGPNYPIDSVEQKSFLRRNPEVDFYIDGEGEAPFAQLYEALVERNFDAKRLKSEQLPLPGVHYEFDGECFLNPLLPRILDLDENIPSPYLTGLMDDFFDDKLNPLVQTSRGCPYSCTFCHDGIAYMNKTRRFSQDRIRAELEYIAQRVKTTALTLADLNWGMFPEDIDTANDLARLKISHNWPQFISSATAKNQKTRVVEMANILGSALQLGASIQSSDAAVLENIQRKNIGSDAIVTMAKASARSDSSTFTEIILCLPGDTKEKHFRSVFDMLDAGIQDMLTYQLIMLPGTQAATPSSRQKYQYQTKFRVLPRCFGDYQIYDEPYPVAEMHEVCVANSTMPHEDYLECRRFNLTLAIFNNGSVFDEVFNFGDALDIKRSRVLERIHKIATAGDSKLLSIYEAFQADEEKNFWPRRELLENFVYKERGLEKYLTGQYGSNQIYRFRTNAILHHFDDLLVTIFEALRAELIEQNLFDQLIEKYLSDLRQVVFACKSGLDDLLTVHRFKVDFDFNSLKALGYRADPRQYVLREAINVTVTHDEKKLGTLKKYFAQYGNDSEGLSHFIHRHSVRELYRTLQFN